VDRAILSKFGFERDLNIAKRVLLLKPTSGVDFHLHNYGRNFQFLWKSIWRHYITLPWVVPLGWNLVERC